MSTPAWFELLSMQLNCNAMSCLAECCLWPASALLTWVKSSLIFCASSSVRALDRAGIAGHRELRLGKVRQQCQARGGPLDEHLLVDLIIRPAMNEKRDGSSIIVHRSVLFVLNIHHCHCQRCLLGYTRDNALVLLETKPLTFLNQRNPSLICLCKLKGWLTC